MSVTTLSHPIGSTEAAVRPVLWRTGLASGLVAAAATSVVATVALAVGVPLTIDGEQIPVLGFGQLTFLCSLLGLALAAGLRRWSATPRRHFVTATLALTALSCVPDLVVEASATTRVVLISTHLVAASIVIPALSRRLPNR